MIDMAWSDCSLHWPLSTPLPVSQSYCKVSCSSRSEEGGRGRDMGTNTVMRTLSALGSSSGER